MDFQEALNHLPQDRINSVVLKPPKTLPNPEPQACTLKNLLTTLAPLKAPVTSLELELDYGIEPKQDLINLLKKARAEELIQAVDKKKSRLLYKISAKGKRKLKTLKDDYRYQIPEAKSPHILNAFKEWQDTTKIFDKAPFDAPKEAQQLYFYLLDKHKSNLEMPSQRIKDHIKLL